MVPQGKLTNTRPLKYVIDGRAGATSRPIYYCDRESVEIGVRRNTVAYPASTEICPANHAQRGQVELPLSSLYVISDERC